MTTTELSKKLGISEAWINRHTSVRRVRSLVLWQSFSPDTDFYRLCSLLVEIGEEFNEPFIDHSDIIVQMNDSFAFIFDHNGKRK